MASTRFACLLAGISLLNMAPGYGLARADTIVARPSSWHLYGSNTLRYDDFNTSGDASSSPYRFTGTQIYDELNLNFDHKITPYNRVTGNFSGLANDSRYRSQFQGVVPERFNLRQENGGFPLPYRAEIGDLFAFQSYRTIQRSLKGVQVEIQPDLGGGIRHSIILFSGSASPNWRDLKSSDGLSSGVSWLLAHPSWGRLGVNLLSNFKHANGATLTSSTQQYVSSLAYENTGQLAGQRLTAEAEIGHFNGDHADLNGPGSGRNQDGSAYFAQLTGNPLALPPLGYRLRFESYDQDYRPDTASIQPDRRSEEGHLSWRFATGLTARGRLQIFRNNRQTINPLDTDIYGLNISGPLFLGGLTGLSGNLDAFRQTSKNRDRTSNTLTRVINANLNKTINNHLSARAGFFYANTRDRNTPANPISITRQYNAGLDYRLRKLGFSAIISPGFLARNLAQNGASNWDYNPTLNINARRGPHNISLSYSTLQQNRNADLGLLTHTIGLNYRYSGKRYSMGLDANWFQRNPDKASTQDTKAWRVGVFVTLNFDKPAQQTVLARSNALVAAPVASVPRAGTDRFILDISLLPPGMTEAQALIVTNNAGLGAPTEQPNLLIWFSRILRDLDQNQRLAVAMNTGTITRTALIIEFDDIGNTRNVKQTYERTLREMLSQYGNPDTFFSQGDFGPDLGVDLAANRFIRVMEWQRNGATLRFGIPGRLDGKIRMELQFARNFPAIKDTLWSLEALQ